MTPPKSLRVSFPSLRSPVARRSPAGLMPAGFNWARRCSQNQTKLRPQPARSGSRFPRRQQEPLFAKHLCLLSLVFGIGYHSSIFRLLQIKQLLSDSGGIRAASGSASNAQTNAAGKERHGRQSDQRWNDELLHTIQSFRFVFWLGGIEYCQVNHLYLDDDAFEGTRVC